VNGKTERIVYAFPFQYFFGYEIEHLLERCGFRVIALYGNFDESPLANDSPEMIFIAEKYKQVWPKTGPLLTDSIFVGPGVQIKQ
jgi:hypothetical protein